MTDISSTLQEYNTFNPQAHLAKHPPKEIHPKNIQSMALKIMKNISLERQIRNKENRIPQSMKKDTKETDDYAKVEASVNSSFDVKDLSKRLYSMEQEICTTQTEIKIKNKKIDELVLENQRISEELQYAQKSIAEKDNEVEAIKSQLSKLKVKFFEVQDSSNKKSNILNEKIAKLEEEIESKAKQIETFNASACNQQEQQDQRVQEIIKEREEEITLMLKRTYDEILFRERDEMEKKIKASQEENINSAIQTTTCIQGAQAIKNGLQIITQLEQRVSQLEGEIEAKAKEYQEKIVKYEEDKIAIEEKLKQQELENNKLANDLLTKLNEIKIKDAATEENENKNRIEHQDAIETIENEYQLQIQQLKERLQQYEEGFQVRIEKPDSNMDEKVTELQELLVTMKLKWKEKKRQMRVNHLEMIDGIVELKSKVPLPYASLLKESSDM